MTEIRALLGDMAELVAELPGPVRRVLVRSADHELEIEWAEPAVPAQARPEQTPGPTAVASPAEPIEPADPGHAVTAPLVGTFYRSPQPGAAPFVEVGDLVDAGQTVAIVEAMKLMNTIGADVAGRVAEICVDDAAPVEFDQPLMRIEPAGAGEAA
ncbi:acetyl-CoA carboxylase biotin carboxyl carrier protein [Actinomadura napierensis]|uniref:Biotin carboxyl carrier protein of acetyl-CoA carboxylase n=1 Tax=Actinomadura napierensis TaxID=267854 RepID=A0ABP5LQT0_9ACTN